LFAVCGFRKVQIATLRKCYKVSTKAGDELIRRAERGGRAREIREAAGLSQAAFAVELTRMAVTYGLDETYDDSKVSRIEAGLRGLTLEEGALVVLLDPEDRGVVWLAFGGPVAKAMRRAKAR
jgi:hypothetical protein